MVHCRVDASTCAENTVAASFAAGAVAVGDGDGSTTDADSKSAGGGGGGITKRVIGKDGSIRLVHAEGCSVGAERGFRKGMLPLRDMKMAWTLAEFAAMDEKYNFKIKRQDASFVGSGGLHLESSAVNDFQSYMRRFQFQQQRFGYLYGKFVDEEGGEEEEETGKKETRKDVKPSGWGARMPENDEKKVKKNAKVIVEAIYEPPQVGLPRLPPSNPGVCHIGSWGLYLCLNSSCRIFSLGTDLLPRFLRHPRSPIRRRPRDS
jgi:hypothetical protein